MNQVRNRFLTSTVMTLAAWQLRRTWFLLLFITLGTIAAIVIVCAIPLLSNVMTTAGLRSTLKATPDSADIALNTSTNGISTPIVQNIHNQFDSLFHRYLGNTIRLEQFAVTSEDFSFYPSQQHTVLTVYGTSIQQAAPHLGPIQGRLAHITSNPASEIELMMTPDTAHQLGVRIGSTLHFSMNYFVMAPGSGAQQSSAMITAHVVGLFTMTPTNAAYWHGEDFAPIKFAVEGSTTFHQYTLLVPDNALLAFFDHIRSTYHHTDAIHTFTPGGYGLIWHYHLDPSQFASNKLDSLVDQFAGIQSTTDSLYGYLENGVSSDFTAPYPILLTSNSQARFSVPMEIPVFCRNFAVASLWRVFLLASLPYLFSRLFSSL